MEQWISYVIAVVLITAAILLQQAADAVKLRDIQKVVSRDNAYSYMKNDYDDAEEPWHYSFLRCYKCYRSSHGPDCVSLQNKSLIEVEKCGLGYDHCMVERLETNGELTTFTRRCAKDCKKKVGCRKSGINYVLERCRTCCDNEDFCNLGTGKGATSLPFTISGLVFSEILFILTVT